MKRIKLKLAGKVFAMLMLSAFIPVAALAQGPSIVDANFQVAGALNKIGPKKSVMQIDLSGTPGSTVTVKLKSLAVNGTAPAYQETKQVTLDATTGKGIVTFDAPGTNVGWTKFNGGPFKHGRYDANANYASGASTNAPIRIDGANMGVDREIAAVGIGGGIGVGN